MESRPRRAKVASSSSPASRAPARPRWCSFRRSECADDAPVLWGACDPLSTPRPLGPLHDVANELDDAARDALRDAAQPHEIFAAVHEHLCEHPSVLVVDDLHWADQGTVDLLRFLLRRVGSTPHAADRHGARRRARRQPSDARAAGRCRRGRRTRSRCALQPLSVAAIETMIDDRPVDARRIEQLTGGNPFFVGEMLAHAGDDLPTSVRDAILSRTTSARRRRMGPAAPPGVRTGGDPRPPAGTVSTSACLPLRAARPSGAHPSRDARCRVPARPVPSGDRHAPCRPAPTPRIHQRMIVAHRGLGAGRSGRARAPRDRRRRPRSSRSATPSRRRGRRRAPARTRRLQRSTGSRCYQGASVGPAQEAEILEAMADECYLIDQLDHAIVACERAMRLREQTGDRGGRQREPSLARRLRVVQREPFGGGPPCERRDHRARRRRCRRRATPSSSISVTRSPWRRTSRSNRAMSSWRESLGCTRRRYRRAHRRSDAVGPHRTDRQHLPPDRR